MTTVAEQNRLLVRGRARALQLEAKLAETVRPLLAAAGREAAAAFQARAGSGRVDRHLDALVSAAPDLRPTSTMIALFPRPEEATALAVPGGEPPEILHVTVAYLGDTTDDQVPLVVDAMRQVAGGHAPLVGKIGGVAAFAAKPDQPAPAVLLPDVPGLVELRVAATEALLGVDGVDHAREHGFTPHVTVAYSDSGPVSPDPSLLGLPVHFDALVVARGDRVEAVLPFVGSPPLTAALIAGAVVAETEVGKRIGAVAAEHAPEGGYGATAWNASEGLVYWVCADWSTNDEVDAAVAAFLEVPEVEIVEWDAEAGLPEGAEWEVVYTEAGVTAAAGDPPAKPPPAWAPPAPDEILDVDALVAKLRTKTDPVRLAAIEAMMTPALEAAGLAWDVTNPFTRRVLEQAGSQIVAIARTTQQDVMRVITASYAEGLSVPDAATAIRQAMREASVARSVLISRTELAGVTNGGSVAAVQQVSEATGDTYSKTWLVAEGARWPRHEEYDGLDGQTVPLDGYFDVGGYQLAYPGDPDGPPGEVCACRCTVVYQGPEGEETVEAEE